jgi:peptidoglycan hydrolase-like protein with peptidoglycan-binding domain
LKKWQAANGLVVDGKFGKNSEAKWRALRGGNAGSAVGTRTGTTNTSQSTYWNSRAKQFGFADSNAVKQWQAANGLVADGKFGANSEAKLRAIQAKQSDKHRDDMAMANLHADATQRGVGQGVLRPMTGDQYALYNQEMTRRAQEEAERKAKEEAERKAEAQARAAEDMYYMQTMISPYKYMGN